MPMPDELAALETFQLAQEFPAGSDPDKFNLDRFVTTAAQNRGRAFFFGPGKCSFCHGGTVLATMTVPVLGQAVGTNGRLNTGVVQRSVNRPGTDNLPCEPSVGACGTRAFSVPSLFNVANNAPFFHDGSAANLIDAVSFYNSSQFGGSPAAIAIGGTAIPATEFDDLIAFLEAISPAGAGPLSAAGASTVADSAPAPPTTRVGGDLRAGGELRRCVRPNRGWYTADRDDDREWPVRADRPRACAGWPDLRRGAGRPRSSRERRPSPECASPRDS